MKTRLQTKTIWNRKQQDMLVVVLNEINESEFCVVAYFEKDHIAVITQYADTIQDARLLYSIIN